MAKLTWRGPDDYQAGETPPSSCTWNGITFPVGVAVEVDHPVMIAKARGNRMFKVEEEPSTVLITGNGNQPATQWREPATEADPKDVSFFDDPPPASDFTDVLPEALDMPPDYPPEDDPERGHPKRRGRPPKGA